MKLMGDFTHVMAYVKEAKLQEDMARNEVQHGRHDTANVFLHNAAMAYREGQRALMQVAPDSTDVLALADCAQTTHHERVGLIPRWLG